MPTKIPTAPLLNCTSYTILISFLSNPPKTMALPILHFFFPVMHACSYSASSPNPTPSAPPQYHHSYHWHHSHPHANTHTSPSHPKALGSPYRYRYQTPLHLSPFAAWVLDSRDSISVSKLRRNLHAELSWTMEILRASDGEGGACADCRRVVALGFRFPLLTSFSHSASRNFVSAPPRKLDRGDSGTAKHQNQRSWSESGVYVRWPPRPGQANLAGCRQKRDG